jgi:hypothetical protein
MFGRGFDARRRIGVRRSRHGEIHGYPCVGCLIATHAGAGRLPFASAQALSEIVNAVR